MAKRTDLKTEDFNLDDDLDFDSFNIDDIGGQMNPEVKKSKKRSPLTDVFKGAISGAAETSKSPAFLAQTLKKALPDSYGTVFSAADEVGKTSSKLYDEAIREIKPELGKLAKKIDRLVPDESKALKRVTSKAASFFDLQSQAKGPSKKDVEDQSIAGSLADVFGVQQKVNQEAEARENAENRVRDKIDGKRFASNFGLLNQISEGVTRLSNYTEKVTQAYQKKSLELQYRMYFTQNELLQQSNRYFEAFKNQNEAIIKNTGLPEFVKINTSERFHDLARTKFMDKFQNSLFGAESPIGKALGKVTKDAKEYIKGMKEALTAANDGVDGVQMLQEMNKTLIEAGLEPMSSARIAGQALGGKAATKTRDYLAGKAKPFLERHKGIRDFGNKAANVLVNPSGAADTIQGSQDFQDAKAGTGLKGLLANFADKLLNYTKMDKPDMLINQPANVGGMNLGAAFDNKTQRSIVDIIPGYLSRILREISVLRTGDDGTDMVVFDHTTGKFGNKKSVYKSMQRVFKNKIESTGQKYSLDKIANNTLGGTSSTPQDDAAIRQFLEDVSRSGMTDTSPSAILSSKLFKKLEKTNKPLSVKVKQHLTTDSNNQKSAVKIKDFYSKLSTIPNMDYTPENIMGTELYSKLDKKTAKLIKEHLNKTVTDSDNKAGGQLDLTSSIKGLQSSTADIRHEIEMFVQAGYAEILEENGIIEQLPNGNYKINEDKYYELVRDGVVKSDKNAKRNIKKLNVDDVLGKKKKPTAMPSGPGRGPGRELVKSDVTTKEDIRPMAPKNALDAIKGTKIYKWFYKLGQGDQVEHTGPMAQDVNKTMGEQAAPDGTKIDLTTMNGHNMAAIQALSDKQDKLAAGDDSASILKMIKEDTAAIVKHFAESGKRSAGASGNLVEGLTSLLGQLPGKVASNAGKAFNVAKGMIKPGSALLGQAGKTALTQGTKGVKGLLSIIESLTAKGKVAVSNVSSKAALLANLTADELMKIRAIQQGALADGWQSDVCKKILAMYPHYAKIDTSDKAVDEARRNPDAGNTDLPGSFEQKSILGYIGKIASNVTSGLASAGGNILFNKIPKAAELLNTLKGYIGDKLKNVINQVHDVYVTGKDSPVIQAMMLKAGGYRDQTTGKVLRTIDDLKAIKGNVIDLDGNIVLTLEQAAKGLFDQHGEKLKGTFLKAMEFAAVSLSNAKDRLKSAWNVLKPAVKGIKDKFSGKLKGGSASSADTISNSDKVYNVLVEIRELLRGNNPAKQDGVSGIAGKAKPTGKDMLGNRDSKFEKWFFADKEKAEKDRSRYVSKHKGTDMLGEKKRMEAKAAARLADFKRQEKQEEDEEQREASKRDPLQADLTPRYQGGGLPSLSAIGSVLSSAKDKAVGAYRSAGGIRGMGRSARGALTALRGGRGIKGKVAGAFGSLFGRRSPGQAEPAAPDTPETPAPQGALVQAPNSKEKNLIIPAGRPKVYKSDAPDPLTSKGIHLKRKPSPLPGEVPAYNDKDASGKRDGAWQDRLEKQEARAKANKKDPLQADLQARYKSDQNIIDVMMAKAGGIFDMAKSGLGSIFEIGSDLLGKKGAGRLLSGAAGLFKAGGIKRAIGGAGQMLSRSGGALARGMGAVRGIATGGRILSSLSMVRNVAVGAGMLTGAAGTAVLGAVGSGLAAIGAFLASPVVLGALAVAAVGYGAYRLYKYANRDNVNDFEDIRMKQYGIGSPSLKSYNHYMLTLEAYLLDGKIGYSGGQAYIIEKSVDMKEVIDIFSIDKDNVEDCQNFAAWYQKRFKPFFLTHLTSLYSVDQKVKLDDVKKLTKEQKLKYLGLIGYDSGPYDVSTSPFKDLPELLTGKAITIASIKVLTDTVSAEGKKDGKNAATKPVGDVGKVVAAKAITDAIKPKAEPKLPKVDTPINKEKNVNAPSAIDKVMGETGEDGVQKDMSNASPRLSSKGSTLKVATGPMKDGKDADQFLDLRQGVKLDTTNPKVLENFRAMVQEYGEKTGSKVGVNSGSRTYEEQLALKRKFPNKAASPGKSLHEFGLAIDIDSKTADELDAQGLMRKYGFTRPVGGEPWHIEPAGIQSNIAQAKNDPSFATYAVENSKNRGGGGVGSIAGSPLGKRNTELALALFDASEQKVNSDKDAVKLLASKEPVSNLPTRSTSPKPQVADPYAVPRMASNPEAKGTTPQVNPMSATFSQSEKYSKTDTLPDIEMKPKGVNNTAANVPPVNYGNKDEVIKAVGDIAKSQGVDPKMMTTFAAVESSLNPNAKASSSSASGLFQFTKAKWNEQMGKNASKHGLDPNTSPTDLKASTLMASESVKEYQRALRGVKSDPNLTDVYLAHFLGMSGAKKFLSANPNDIAADVMKTAAKSNPGIFYDNGRALTIAEVYSKISNKLTTVAKQFNLNLPSAPVFAGKEGKAANDAAPASSAFNVSPPVATAQTTADRGSINAPMVNQRPTSRPSITGMSASTVMSSNPVTTMSRGMGNNIDVLTNIDKNGSAQLQVQKDMLEVMKTIAKTMNPEALKEMLSSLSKSGDKAPTASGQRPTQPEQMKSAIDLQRRAA